MANEGQTLEQRSGILNGEIIGSDEDNDSLFASGGEITGDITGFETIQVAGSLDLDGNVLKNTAEDQKPYSFVVSESGRLNLVSPTSINADYSQQGVVNVYPGTTGSPYIQIDGTARIENGAVINVLPATLDEASYSILSATNGLSVAENILRLQSTIVFDITQVVTNDVLEARITRANMAQNLLSDTGNVNIATFADTLQTALNTLSGDALTNTLEQLNRIQTSEEFVAVIENAIPGLNNETQTALFSAANAVQDGAFNNILSHLSDLRNTGSGIGTGDLPYSGGVWVKALHTEADQGQQRDGGTTYNGYKARSKGFTLGGDIELSPEWTLGTAFSFADVTVNVKDSGNNTTMDSYQLSLYGDWQQNNWFANGILNVGYNDVDSKRYAGSTRYEADYGSKQFGVNVTGGYQFWLNKKDTLIEPQLVLNYSLLDTDSYKERSQAGDVIEVRPHNQEVIELGAGVRLSHLIETDRGPLLPELRLFAYHDFKADKVTQNVTAEAFNLPLSFRTVGIEPEKTRYQAGLGVSYWMDNNFSLSLNYDHTWQSDFKADSVQAKVRYDF